MTVFQCVPSHAQEREKDMVDEEKMKKFTLST